MITITALEQRLLPDAIELMRDTWKDTCSGYLSSDVVEKVSAVWHDQNLLNKQMMNPDVKFLAAWEGDSLAGVSTVVNRGDGSVVIGRFYVRPSRQGRGVGKKLYEKAASVFPGTSRIHVEVDEGNRKGVLFLEKLGFSVTGSRTEYLENVPVKVLILEKGE